MDKNTENKGKRKVSVGRSLTMRFTNCRNRGKSVDKCGRLTGNVSNLKPLSTSVSMGAMDKVNDTDNCSDPCTNCDITPRRGLCSKTNLPLVKLKGFSTERLTCVQCESERLHNIGSNTRDSSDHRSGVSPGPSGCHRTQAPADLPPALPPQRTLTDPLAKSWDRIYASRKGWLIIITGELFLMLNIA